ncbi:MAG: S9 family peptidase, partial [Halobacteriales archaeon]
MNRVEAADYHDVVQLADPRVAPDGDRVAFVRKEPDDEESYESTVYVAPTGGGDPRRYTIAEGVDSEPRWSPGGDRIAFVSTRGADDDRPQLWVVPTDGGEGRQVTDVAGGVSNLAWSPDGERIAFVQQASEADREEDRDLEVPEEFEPEPPDPRVVDRTVWRSMQDWFDGKRGQVYVVDLADDEVERITAADYDHNSPEWGDAGTLYYTVARDEPDPDDSYEYDVVAYDVETGETETVHTSTGWAAALAATDDGRVAFTYTEPEQATLKPTELQVVEADTGEVHEPMASLDRTLGYDAAPQWGPDEELLYFATPDEGASALWAAPWEGDEPDRVLREDWSSIHDAHVGDDVVAFVRSEWDHPGDLFVATRGGAEQRRLTRVNADYLDERAVSRPVEVTFESEDGVELQGWVLTPPDFEEGEEYPLAVEVHGGPHAMWTTAGTMWHEFQTLAARGYVVFW